MTLEYLYDDHTLLYGTIREEDDSFDHEFGVEKRSHLEVGDFHVIVYIGGIDYDVTKGLKPEELQSFKESYLEWASKRYEKDAV